MPDELTQKVVTIISEARHIPPQEITLDSKFDDLGVDSLVAMGIIYDLESEYNIELPNEDVFTIRDVRGLIAVLRKMIAGEGAEDAGAVA